MCYTIDINYLHFHIIWVKENCKEVFMLNPYSVLGVSKTASEKEIKSAFRKLAKQHHPDHNPNDKSAQDKFSKINQAYEILGDAKKRAQFDRGEIDGEGKPGFQGFTGADPFSSAGSSGGFNFKAERGFDASDILRDIFGASGASGSAFGMGANNSRKGADIAAEAYISLQQLIANEKIEVRLQNGKALKIQLPKYLEDGQVIRLRGQGEKQAFGPSGDALITIKIKKDPIFEVKGRDLYMDLPIQLKDAVQGGKISAETLDGTLAISIPEWSSSGKLFRLKGKGLPTKAGGRADLYIRLLIMLPDKQDKKLKALFNEDK